MKNIAMKELTKVITETFELPVETSLGGHGVGVNVANTFKANFKTIEEAYEYLIKVIEVLEDAASE